MREKAEPLSQARRPCHAHAWQGDSWLLRVCLCVSPASLFRPCALGCAREIFPPHLTRINELVRSEADPKTGLPASSRLSRSLPRAEALMRILADPKSGGGLSRAQVSGVGQAHGDPTRPRRVLCEPRKSEKLVWFSLAGRTFRQN